MAFLPRFVTQMDGSRCESANCGPASHSTFVHRATRGLKIGSPSAIRQKINLYCPGTSFAQNRSAIGSLYGVTDVEYHWQASMATFEAGIKAGRGATTAIMYSVLHGTPYDACRTFDGRHFIFVSDIRYNATLKRSEALVYDPLANKRYDWVPQGPQWWPLSLLEKGMNAYASGSLEFQFTRNTEWVSRKTVCGVGVLRAAASGSSASIANLPVGTVLYSSVGSIAGGSWIIDCNGVSKAGTTWYKVTAVNGKSTQALYGVPAAYVGTGRCA